VNAGAESILLDNMSDAHMRECVDIARTRCITEASGGVKLGTVRAIAETGVDRISIGALTHSAPALNLALDLE
jgi:nicotinate-nucleotide pyrophosphorylase (carboxylating)